MIHLSMDGLHFIRMDPFDQGESCKVGDLWLFILINLEVKLELYYTVFEAFSPYESEISVITTALLWAQRKRIPKVQIFSDCLDVVETLNRRAYYQPILNTLVCTVWKQFGMFQDCRINFIPREGNQLADRIGRLKNMFSLKASEVAIVRTSVHIVEETKLRHSIPSLRVKRSIGKQRRELPDYPVKKVHH